jgi:hypothetical protein
LVDALVTYKKGNHVHDLTRNDFNVYEDHKKQSVTSFSFGADTAIQPQQQKWYFTADADLLRAADEVVLHLTVSAVTRL